MRHVMLALTIALSAMLPAAADTAPITGPQEVGNTTMPAGQYYVTEQISHKSYSLTVTQKGNMILGPAPEGLEVKIAGSATPATPGTPATPATAATTPAVAPAATAAAGAPPTQATTNSLVPTGVAGDMMKGLVKQGMQKGVNELMKQGVKQGVGGTKGLENLLK